MLWRKFCFHDSFNFEKIDRSLHYSLLMALDRDKQVQGDISHHLFSLVAELNGYLLVARDDGVDIYRYFGEKNTSLDDTSEVRSK